MPYLPRREALEVKVNAFEPSGNMTASLKDTCSLGADPSKFHGWIRIVP